MTSVRRYVLVVLAVAVLATLTYMTFGRTRTVPDVTFGLLSGQKVMTSELRGKVYLVNFWASNCAPCIREMPQMTETYNKFKGKDFDLIAVAMHYDPPANVANYTQTQHLPFKVALDPDGGLARQFYKVRMTPITFVVDKNGRIVKRIVGEPDFPALHALIQRELARPL